MKQKGGNKNPRRKKEWLRMETFKWTRYGEHISFKPNFSRWRDLSVALKIFNIRLNKPVEGGKFLNKLWCCVGGRL